MKLQDREIVDGTGVAIGRRVQHRKLASGEVVTRVSATYTAEYQDANGQRRFEGLSATNKREARRKALEIQQRLEKGERKPLSGRIAMAELVKKYAEHCRDKGLAPKTLAKYSADLAKLLEFCAERGIVRADRFDEAEFLKFGAWLRERTHKQGVTMAPKSVFTALTIAKQTMKFAWKQKLLPGYALELAQVAPAKARRQPCLTSEQVEGLLSASEGDDLTHGAIAILAYTGMRVGELIQLRWEDVQLDVGDHGVVHICRGGSAELPKDREARTVPLHPRARAALESLPRKDSLVLPGLNDRTLLANIKRLCKRLGYGGHYKTHSLRHHFASMIVAKGVAYRLALEWMGHSSSSILELYVTIFDQDSQKAMTALAAQTMRTRS